MNRVIAYVDGFNLYFGLKEKGWKQYYWLNVQLMCENLVLANQQLVTTKYFTARVNSPADKARRQSTYLEALMTLPNVRIFYGNYLSNVATCVHCGHQHLDSKEKMTDVNIAVEMISDSISNVCDVALLISADSDLVPALGLVKKIRPATRVVIGFPPARNSLALKAVADSTFQIWERTLAKSVLPDPVVRQDGYRLLKPVDWSKFPSCQR